MNTRIIAKKIRDHSTELIAFAAIVRVVYQMKGYRLVPTEGHFIPKADFERLLSTDDTLILMTPLGEFRVTPY